MGRSALCVLDVLLLCSVFLLGPASARHAPISIYSNSDFTPSGGVIKPPVLDKEGNVIGIAGIARDVTAQKKAEIGERQLEQTELGTEHG
jgi:hypothetical protein